MSGLRTAHTDKSILTRYPNGIQDIKLIDLRIVVSSLDLRQSKIEVSPVMRYIYAPITE